MIPTVPSPPATSSREGLWPVWDFAVHVTVGTLMFVIIAIAASSLSVLHFWLAAFQVDVVVLYGLKLAEYALFATDLILFLVFLAKTAVRAARSF